MKTDIRPIRSLLIANRGEIARRIIRTCRDMGIRSIAVFSDADRFSPYVEEADEAVYIGPSAPSRSYLNKAALLEAAGRSGADAVHPGYGFLSEHADFAQAVVESGLIWVGPHPEAIRQMGSKAGAKALVAQHGVPVIPGYSGEDQRSERLKEEAMQIGFPLLVKASAGGGGKGMVIVRKEKDLADALSRAAREALQAFGDDRLILERYFEQARHIEFQVFGDQQGNMLHLYERECTLQRRYQKILEESPSPALQPDQRQRMAEAAIAAARAVHYDNAGTVEFIAMPDGSFCFLEVNTRLQVEHPVTEKITGFDLVREQIRVAEGHPLSWKQEDVAQNGYALELRLYAENPASGFLPVAGTVHRFKAPSGYGIRCDAGVVSGSVIGTDYDPMIAKLIAHGESREATFRKMDAALEELECLGLTTNQVFLRQLLRHPDVQSGQYDTHFLDRHPELCQVLELPEEQRKEVAEALTAIQAKRNQNRRNHLSNLPPAWNPVGALPSEAVWEIQGKQSKVQYLSGSDGLHVQAAGDGAQKEHRVIHRGNAQGVDRVENNGRIRRWIVEQTSAEHFWIQVPEYGPIEVRQPPRFPLPGAERNPGDYTAPVPGEVIALHVEADTLVKAGEPLLVLYSMKMEHTIRAEVDGKVKSLHVRTGDQVTAGTSLLQLEILPEESDF